MTGGTQAVTQTATRAGEAAVTLLVMAKEPVAGRVKTRLCPPCDHAQAAALAEAALADTLDVVAATPASTRVVVLDGAPGPWLPDGFSIVPQGTGGLDERLARAFTTVPGPALLVGMDTPQITPMLLSDAIDQLMTPGVDAALGLAFDGGWWCIGLRAPDPRVFVGVEMSSPTTGEQQLKRLNRLGLQTKLLPELRDVDYFADAAAVAREAPFTRFARCFDQIESAAQIESAMRVQETR